MGGEQTFDEYCISLKILSSSKSLPLVEAWNRQDYGIWYIVYYTIHFEFLTIFPPHSEALKY